MRLILFFWIFFTPWSSFGINKSGIAVLGRMVVDYTCYCDEKEIEDELNSIECNLGSAVKIDKKDFANFFKKFSFSEKTFGGSGANVAHNLGLMGDRVAIFSISSIDDLGKEAVKPLKKSRC